MQHGKRIDHTSILLNLLHNCIANNTEYKPHKQIALYIQTNQQQLQKDTNKGDKEQGQEIS